MPGNAKNCQEVHTALAEQPGHRELFRACFSAGWVDGETSAEKAMIIIQTEKTGTSSQCQLLSPSLP